jgi:uncharacterized protein YjbI with pentapeptide repeats
MIDRRSVFWWIGLALLLAALLWFVPQLQGRYLSENVPPKEVPSLVNEYRRTWAQILGGAALLAGLYFTWRTLHINREGQITERFTKAIDQLGDTDDDGEPRLEIRLGGIYALERIAKDSPARDFNTVVEVLSAYVRENAKWSSRSKVSGKESRGLRADIQAILTFIGEPSWHDARPGHQKLSLSNTDLRFGDLSAIHLRGADLHGVHWGLADLREAHLESANLYRAHLEGANLSLAHLEGANVALAHLEGTNFRGARLERVNLYEAHLEAADLREAHLEGADLYRAHLEGSNLQGVDLRALRNLEAEPERIDQEQIRRAIGNDETELPSHLERPRWWERKLPEGIPLVKGRYSTEVFRPALSFSVSDQQSGWRHDPRIHQHHPGCLTIQDFSMHTTSHRYQRLSFVHARGVFDRNEPSLDRAFPIPESMFVWFRTHPYLETAELVQHSYIGGERAVLFDAVVSRVPDEYPPECFLPCVVLLDLGYGYGNWYHFNVGYKYRVIILNTNGDEVIIIVESPKDAYDAFLAKAMNLLSTVEWNSGE